MFVSLYLKDFIFRHANVNGIVFFILKFTYSLVYKGSSWLLCINFVSCILPIITTSSRIFLADWFFYKDSHVICEKKIVLSSFPACIPLIYFSCFIALAHRRVSSTFNHSAFSDSLERGRRVPLLLLAEVEFWSPHWCGWGMGSMVFAVG